MQRYTTFFIIVNAVHVSGGFSAHHQELKNCTHSISTLYDACQRQATYKVLHNTSCILQSIAPEDGHNYCPKHVELTLEC